MRKTVYILGNPLVDSDSLPIKMMPSLKKKFPRLYFSHFDPTENWPDEKNLILIDSIYGIAKVRLFGDIDDFKLSPRVSAHDFDVKLSLGMMKKLGKIKKLRIIGIPEGLSVNEAISQTVKIITGLTHCHSERSVAT